MAATAAAVGATSQFQIPQGASYPYSSIYQVRIKLYHYLIKFIFFLIKNLLFNLLYFKCYHRIIKYMFQTNQYGLTPSHTTPHVTAFTPLNTDSAMPVSIFLIFNNSIKILLFYLRPNRIIHFPYHKKNPSKRATIWQFSINRVL